MSAFQDTSLFAQTGCSTAANDHLRSLRSASKTIRKSSSLAALYGAARHPAKTVQGARDALEGWYDGLTKEEREQKSLRDAKKQVLYLQQRNVSETGPQDINCQMTSRRQQP